MSIPLDIFCSVPCLTENTKLFSGIELQKKWFKGTDKRVLGQYLQKFVNYNSSLLGFLGVTPIIVGSDQNSKIYFKTSRFIGAIPLRSPENGKQIGDFVVTPRYSENSKFEHIEILNLLGNDLSPETVNSLPLASGRNFRPPMYLEALRFINALDKLLNHSWRKFDRIEKQSQQPIGNINWKKYIEKESLAEHKFNFPVGVNILSEYHQEYSQIRFVFDLCRDELLSQNTPLKIKLGILDKLTFLEGKLYKHNPSFTKQIIASRADSPTVSECKSIANKILLHDFTNSTAWRVDFSNVFEKFIQFIFKEVASEIGGRLLSNYRFKAYSSYRYSWELSYVEPDAIYQKDKLAVFIDAKYKSHLYNKYEESEFLKEEHRNDLHQIMSYSSFCGEKIKYGILCYPSNNFELKNITYTNTLNQTKNNIKIVGIPLKRVVIREAKISLSRELSNLYKTIYN